MRIEELSVGDWVRAWRGICYRVVGIYLTPAGEIVSLQRGEDTGQCYCKHIKPIPITPEILEENGFVEIRGDFVATNNGIYANVEVRENRYSLEVSSDGRIIIACDIKSVHQLQHALRLARVGKEIEV